MTTDYNQLAEKLHRDNGGKLATDLRHKGEVTRHELSAYYTPGVGHVSSLIAKDPSRLREFTWTRNLVAVISDGSAVLGLGNIGPEASLPVMEGKALLFKYFADLDSVPIVLDCKSTEEVIETIQRIAPSFGAINLEDFAAPQCFEIESRLRETLSIPVFHDDQHGTAIVVLAALINACKVTGKDLGSLTIVIAGIGAAGTAIARLIKEYAPGVQIVGTGRSGALTLADASLNAVKRSLLEEGILEDVSLEGQSTADLKEVMCDADVFIGVSAPGLVDADMVRSMAPDPIVMALSNPIPEIYPDEAAAAGAAVICTGRSDFPNQVNNALAFPGIFRGALDHKVSQITEDHKMLAAKALADFVKDPTAEKVIPSIFDEGLAQAVAKVIT
ncbi:MAG: NADP-dependent malic enzyme [Coriobacteriia bacterium]|nr:NADP-dependent malic enzyme [Coriobacteriia bacterium]MCL2745767.1 NADP-dependent malic enzyme [Coriobacteriia bacterium]MCL2870216.1 NADP-dependent malic enzyme [Coriobacteriia bacterium]